MALFHRHLITVLLGSLSLGLIAPLFAQPEPTVGDDVIFRTFSASLDKEISGLFYDLRSRQVPVAATNLNLSSPYTSPPGGLVALYRELPPLTPEEKPRRLRVADVRLGPGGPWLLLLTTEPNRETPDQPVVRTHLIDHSWKAHPVAHVNILNLCRTPITLQLGSETVELAPGQSRLQPYPAANHLWLKAAVLTDGQWEVRLSTPQRIMSATTRATWALFDRPITLDTPTPRILVRNLVESSPPAPVN